MILANAFAGPTLAFYDRASLISRYAASGKVRQEIPLPAEALLFRFGQVPPVSNTSKLLNPALPAHAGLQLALREGHKLIALTGSPDAKLGTILQTVLQDLGYGNIYSGPISSAGTLLDSLSDESTDDRKEPAEQIIFVVENAQTLSVSSLQLLMQLAKTRKRLSMQVLLTGRPELSRKLGEGRYRTLASNVVEIALEPELEAKPKFRVESDLARAWEGAEAAKRQQELPHKDTTSAVSPFPALAALLNQSAPSRSLRTPNGFILTLIVVLSLAICSGIVGLSDSIRRHLPFWTSTSSLK